MAAVARMATQAAAKRSAASSLNGFFQESFQLGNQFDEDPVLPTLLKRHMSKEAFAEVSADLRRLSDVSLNEYKAYGDDAETNLPRVEPFDLFGRRVDKLVTSLGWRKLHDVAAVEGLVAIAYERKFGPASRLYQMAKLWLWSPTTATYGCPLAMTDGAARLIELSDSDYLKTNVLPRLTSRDPSKFWTSGQWMTERPGGSDVGRTETEAVRQPDGTYSVSGFKWFSSATDSDITLLLARNRDPTTNAAVDGSKGLSLFYGRVRNDEGKLNGIRIVRLKNKMGTKALPTAELELDNMQAMLVGKEGRGVPTIATILNITRVWSAMTSASGMRRAVNMVRDYATRREAFGQRLSHQPLHIATLANMELEARAAELFTFDVAHLLGQIECNQATKDAEALLRLLTPIVKLYVCKQAVATLSEAMEALGGQGYIEDTGIARGLRDTQVNCIWGGTTNVLSLDVLRVFATSPQALEIFTARVNVLLGDPTSPQAIAVRNPLGQIKSFLQASMTLSREATEGAARKLAYALARVYSAALLVDHAQYTRNEEDALAAHRWINNLTPAPLGLGTAADTSRDDFVLVYGRAKL